MENLRSIIVTQDQLFRTSCHLNVTFCRKITFYLQKQLKSFV